MENHKTIDVHSLLPENERVDLEKGNVTDLHLHNSTILDYMWQDVTITVTDRKTKQPRSLLHDVSGIVKAGEICALMGPSGCGKTTLLNVLAHRDAAVGGKPSGTRLINGVEESGAAFRRISSYVEQEDALIGSLTVRETMDFAAKLSQSIGSSKSNRKKRIDELLDSFGLQEQQHTIIGTPIRKGISGGQKRRVSVASQLITGPKLLFLDEITSGLDSAASWEVISFIKSIAKRHNLIVIASIHQPSTSTFTLFDKVLLLSGGRSHYFGTAANLAPFFGKINCPIPLYTNPAEFVLEILNTDFAQDRQSASRRLNAMQIAWEKSEDIRMLNRAIKDVTDRDASASVHSGAAPRVKFLALIMALVHRAFIKSYRDVVTYGLRIAMYIGLAIMMGTVWLRLGSSQNDIQPFTNAIFFGSAFMSFMAVAYVPAFLEDHATFLKERGNGLYGAAPFVISNFIMGLPYLFIIAVLFSVVAYWLSGFEPTANAFFMWIMWLFLDLVAAESLVVLMSSLMPNFVVALTLTAFANGLWMSVGGFLVPPSILNDFWYYGFSFIDYQRWVFQGMMVNQFQNQTYSCDADCNCIYQTALASECKIAGSGVLEEYGYKTGLNGTWVGILIGIIAGYRLLGWAALAFRK
ncbi:P-loop containing nucleoside triphosphate hydrolase protein [Calycina marina]|uniref:P-loop containing nucleoside triphosphate hydrolase protein n=1 Tax=Calycina marina TaxID=1763456 RepID=A0A9P7YWD1_9HELO|nr:P-loop containing nucleoside triphosphate hydrolase protein [Calycina marina]